VRGCGTPALQKLITALRNPNLPAAVRDEVEAIRSASRGTPLYESTPYLTAHFAIFYSLNDALEPRNNVTAAQVANLGTLLEAAWQRFVVRRGYLEPLLDDGVDLTSVEVSWENSNVWGSTGYADNGLWINSRILNEAGLACELKTTPGHELYHRIQFSYGLFKPGPYWDLEAEIWLAEGTATWTHKYAGKLLYMGWMNEGLQTTDLPLIEEDAAYASLPFWVYQEEYMKKRFGRPDPIKLIWDRYGTGLNAKAAVNAAVAPLSFDRYFHEWIKANYLKQLVNPPGFLYDYTEDEKVGAGCMDNGPLYDIRGTGVTVTGNSFSTTIPGTVPEYGAAYHEFFLPRKLTNLYVKAEGNGSGKHAFTILGIKKNRLVFKKSSTGKAMLEYRAFLYPGQWDKMVVIVGGLSPAGAYQITVGKPIPLTITPSTISAYIGCQINPPPSSGSFLLWSGSVYVDCPDGYEWVATPAPAQWGADVVLNPSTGKGPGSVSVVINYPSQMCWCPCSLSWASGSVAEFRGVDQPPTKGPKVLSVEVDDSSCWCNMATSPFDEPAAMCVDSSPR
jgi:hypothetical protein